MVSLGEDRVFSNTDYLLGAVMEARANLHLDRRAITGCSLCTITALFSQSCSVVPKQGSGGRDEQFLVVMTCPDVKWLNPAFTDEQ